MNKSTAINMILEFVDNGAIITTMAVILYSTLMMALIRKVSLIGKRLFYLKKKRNDKRGIRTFQKQDKHYYRYA